MRKSAQLMELVLDELNKSKTYPEGSVRAIANATKIIEDCLKETADDLLTIVEPMLHRKRREQISENYLKNIE
jgi:hypothetical protein